VRKLMLAAGAAATMVVPATAMAANGHKPAKGATVKVCVTNKKHGLKAHVVTGKCKSGEKALTVHLPAGAKGATGAQGPAGPQGPAGAAGSYAVKDANGNVVGTLVGFDGYYDYVLFGNGIIEGVDMGTGQLEDQYTLEYTSTDCSGPAYVGGPAIPQSPFDIVNGNASAGDPLYTTSGVAQTITVGSQSDGKGGCTTVNYPWTMDNAYTPSATGYTQPATPVGPLTIAQQ